jgi:hypothetical protein
MGKMATGPATDKASTAPPAASWELPPREGVDWAALDEEASASTSAITEADAEKCGVTELLSPRMSRTYAPPMPLAHVHTVLSPGPRAYRQIARPTCTQLHHQGHGHTPMPHASGAPVLANPLEVTARGWFWQTFSKQTLGLVLCDLVALMVAVLVVISEARKG